MRFAAKYRIPAGAGLGRARPPGPRLGPDPDARLRRPGGVPASRCATPTSSATRPACCTSRRSSSCRPRRCRRPRGGPRGTARVRVRRDAQVLMHSQGQARRAVQSEGDAGHRRRDPREVPRARDPRAERVLRASSRPARTARAAQLMPVLGSGHPAGRHLPDQVLGAAVRGRGGRRVLRPHRQRADEVAQAAADRPAGGLRDAVRQVPGRRPGDGRPGLRGAAGRGARDRLSRRSSS